MPVDRSIQPRDESHGNEKLFALCSELEQELDALQKEEQQLKADIAHTLDQEKMKNVLQHIVDLPHT